MTHVYTSQIRLSFNCVYALFNNVQCTVYTLLCKNMYMIYMLLCYMIYVQLCSLEQCTRYSNQHVHWTYRMFRYVLWTLFITTISNTQYFKKKVQSETYKKKFKKYLVHFSLLTDAGLKTVGYGGGCPRSGKGAQDPQNLALRKEPLVWEAWNLWIQLEDHWVKMNCHQTKIIIFKNYSAFLI